MRTPWLLAAAVAVSAGCQPDDPVFSGYPMADYFPFDGQIIGWRFGNRSTDPDYTLDRTFDPTASVTVADVVHHTMALRRVCLPEAEGCTGGFAYSYVMSSSPSLGVRFHGYERAGEAAVVLDPPIRLADVKMAPTLGVEQPPANGVVTTSGSDGHDWTSTFLELTDCDQTFSVAWSCALLRLESDPPGHWLSGDWYAVPGFNVVSFELAEDPGRWRMVSSPSRP
jgi:hypothetical protein